MLVLLVIEALTNFSIPVYVLPSSVASSFLSNNQGVRRAMYVLPLLMPRRLLLLLIK
jgi:hypothetical protein